MCIVVLSRIALIVRYLHEVISEEEGCAAAVAAAAAAADDQVIDA